MSVVAALPEIPVTRIFELRRDEVRDQTYWHEVDEVRQRGSLSLVVTCWLYEREPVAGSYRASRAGVKPLDVTWTGDELLAA